MDTFIPNDTQMGKPAGTRQMVILTGPNASGKSIYLKQVALIVYMAHIGSFCTASAASIGLVDGIFSRIHTRETVSVARSAFQIDLSQVAQALRRSTPRSLMIIDEFGKGTESFDGIALLASVLQELLDRGADCPRTLVSTHFHELHEQQLLQGHSIDAQVCYLQTEVLEQAGSAVFLYHIVPGHCRESFGCTVAALAGVPSNGKSAMRATASWCSASRPPHRQATVVVARGRQIAELLVRNEPIEHLDMTSTLAERVRRSRMIVDAFMDYNVDDDDPQVLLQLLVTRAA